MESLSSSTTVLLHFWRSESIDLNPPSPTQENLFGGFLHSEELWVPDWVPLQPRDPPLSPVLSKSSSRQALSSSCPVPPSAGQTTASEPVGRGASRDADPFGWRGFLLMLLFPRCARLSTWSVFAPLTRRLLWTGTDLHRARFLRYTGHQNLRDANNSKIGFRKRQIKIKKTHHQNTEIT